MGSKHFGQGRATPARGSVRLWLAAAALWIAPLLWFLWGPIPELESFSPAQARVFLRGLFARLLIAWAVWGLWLRLRERLGWHELAERYVGAVSAQSLAYARILVCGVLLLGVLWEDLPSTALLPPSMRQPVGVTALVNALGEGWMDQARTLWAFQALTAVLLALAMLGFKTRFTLPAAALAHLIFGGLFRQYFKAYHTGLTPWLLLVALCLGPCADAWSLDAWLGRRRGQAPAGEPSYRYGWARYTLLFVLAAAYTEAGLSKLANAGPYWWKATRMRGILYADSLNPMEFDFDGGLWLARAPDGLFALLGLTAFAGEIAMATMLVSQRARLLMPGLMIAMHVGILFTQNILFYDLILVLSLPYAWWWLDRRTAAPARPARGPGAIPSRGMRWLAVALVLPWVFGAELYPLTSWQMYSLAPDDGTLTYYAMVAESTTGERFELRPDRLVPALRDARHRRVLGGCFEPSGTAACDAFMARMGELFARERGIQVRRVEAQRWRWNFLDAPRDPDHGEVVALRRLTLPPP